MMLVDVFQVGLDDFRAMIGVVDLDAVKRHLGTHLVEQGGIIEGEAMFATARMGDETNGSAAMRGIHRLCHIGQDSDKTGLAKYFESALPIGGIAMFAQEPAIVGGPDQL